MQEWKDFQAKNKDRFLEELLELLRIPSVSARSEHTIFFCILIGNFFKCIPIVGEYVSAENFYVVYHLSCVANLFNVTFFSNS